VVHYLREKESRPYKRWVGGIFILLIFVFTLVVWWAEKSGGACYEADSAQTSTNSAAAVSLNRDAIPQKQESPKEENKTSTNSESYFCRLIAPANLPNIYLVLIGFGGILAAIYTLEVISQQARSMRYQTKIIRRSLDAQVASERAWVMVDIWKGEPFLMDGSKIIRDGPKTYTTAAFVQCRCINQGKTPCRITEVRARMVMLESVDSTDALPKDPDLVATEIKVSVPTPIAANGEPPSWDFSVECQGNREVGKILVIYGVVKYRHMFSEEEVQTTFGYKITPGDQLVRLSKPPKYNENT
jgi:hypothetical protein